ncbi:CHAT domain-containing protein [Streptomyces sp. NPDC097981]|uniref:CHAT domain-containing protein n=1 Tax=Streptomyces sp. NPDC097981 TaxID=3155428 RepID=UPI00331B9DEA
MEQRDELRAAVWARVQQLVDTGDSAAVLATAGHDEAYRLARHVAANRSDLDGAFTLGWFYYCRAASLPPTEAEEDRKAAIRYLTACFIVGMRRLPHLLLPAIAENAAPTAKDLLSRMSLPDADPEFVASVVELWRRVAHGVPADHPDYVMYLSDLGTALQKQYERTGELSLLDEGVEAGYAAFRATSWDHPGYVATLSNLGFTLQERFDRAGKLTDLDAAVLVGRAAAQAAGDGSPHVAACLTMLGSALGRRFIRTGNPEDLEEAVDVTRAAVRSAPDGHPDRVMCLSNLGLALQKRHERTGNLQDLDEAVDAARAAVQASTADHSHYAACQTNLGLALAQSFAHTGELADLEEAVDAARAAVQATPEDHPGRGARLTNLASVLASLFRRTEESEDLEQVVEACRAAVRAIPEDHPDHVAPLASLSSVLRKRFERTGQLGDLEEAVEAGRAVIRATPDDHPDHARRLAELGFALAERSERTGEPGDLEEAVEVCRVAVLTTPDDRADALGALAFALRIRYERSREPADREEALSLLGQSVDTETALPSQRIGAACAAANLAASSDPGRAADFLERAVLMLPEVAPRRLRRGARQHALGSNAAFLGSDAAALALADTRGKPEDRATRALRLAEAGRAVLLSHALDMRSDLTDLREQHPALAERFAELRKALDQDPVTAAGDAPDDHRSEGRERRRLAAEFEQLLGRIRACEGFAHFALPPSREELLEEAAHGPIVTFNVNRHRSDALLLTRHGISSVSLPRLTRDAVVEQVVTFHWALTNATAPGSDRIAAQQMLRGILEWLWEAAAEPVLAALEDLGETVPPVQDGESLPRVWWAPGGLLGMLPLHAAGFHTEPAHGRHRRTVLDRVISSYTPTVRALRHARTRCPRPAGQSLIVAMPTTPGHAPLRHVPEEARRIRDLLHCPVQLTEPAPARDGTPGPAGIGTPTTAAVLSHLPQCAIAHFACHGADDHTDPSQSRLLLHDHVTAPLTVSTLAQVSLDHAQLAYLSACGTADLGGMRLLAAGAASDRVRVRESLRLLDEAIHLTSAFQLAGFPHVVGTLWQIDDRLAAEIAESFYKHLTEGPRGMLAPDRAATALHHTIRTVRDRFPATPSLWAAHVHAGA